MWEYCTMWEIHPDYFDGGGVQLWAHVMIASPALCPWGAVDWAHSILVMEIVRN